MLPWFAYDDFYIAIQSRKKIHQAFNRKTFKFVIGKSGDFGLVYLQQVGRLRLIEFTCGNDVIDCHGELKLGLTLGSIGKTEVSKNVGAAVNNFFHCLYSLPRFPWRLS